MARRVDQKVCLDPDRTLCPEHRTQSSVGKMSGGDDSTLQRNSQPLRCGIQRHLRPIKAQCKALRRTL